MLIVKATLDQVTNAIDDARQCGPPGWPLDQVFIDDTATPLNAYARRSLGKIDRFEGDHLDDQTKHRFAIRGRCRRASPDSWQVASDCAECFAIGSAEFDASLSARIGVLTFHLFEV